MRLSTVFSESFLDGFTMGGFFKRLGRPGAATQMFAPTPTNSDWQPVTFEQASGSASGVEVAGDLRAVPEPVLRTMITLLNREDEKRKLSRETRQKAEYGSSR